MLRQSSAIRSCLRSSAWRRASATTRGGKPANSATKAPQNRSTSVIVLSSNVSEENMKSNISSLEWTEISNCLSGHIVHVYDSIAVFLFKKNTKYLILQHIGSMAITLICSSIGQGIKECQPEIALEVDWLGSRGKSLLENLEFPFPPSKNTTFPWDNPPAALRLDYSGRMPLLLRNRWQLSKISRVKLGETWNGKNPNLLRTAVVACSKAANSWKWVAKSVKHLVSYKNQEICVPELHLLSSNKTTESTFKIDFLKLCLLQASTKCFAMAQAIPKPSAVEVPRPQSVCSKSNQIYFLKHIQISGRMGVFHLQFPEVT